MHESAANVFARCGVLAAGCYDVVVGGQHDLCGAIVSQGSMVVCLEHLVVVRVKIRWRHCPSC